MEEDCLLFVVRCFVIALFFFLNSYPFLCLIVEIITVRKGTEKTELHDTCLRLTMLEAD